MIAPPARRDPISVLEAQAANRLPDLVGIRYGRMLASPFAFYRGGAAIMAMDLATVPPSGLTVQLCGDAHLANFGMYASPERALVFDINDFDETLPGPFEWDVKRLAASFVVAARANQFTAAQSRAAARAVVAAYREAMLRFAGLGNLATWYTHLTVDDITSLLASPKQKRNVQSWIMKARSNTSLRAFEKLTTVVGGRRRIVDDPPLIERVPAEAVGKDIGSHLSHAFNEYLRSLDPGERSSGYYGTYLFGRFHTTGEDLTADLDLNDHLELTLEHGIGGMIEIVPFNNGQQKNGFLPTATNPQGDLRSPRARGARLRRLAARRAALSLLLVAWQRPRPRAHRAEHDPASTNVSGVT